MTVLGTMDAPLDQFGGLVTDMAPADLPAGVSPDCADVAFLPGAVKTRPGLLSVFTAIGGNPTINYLKTFAEQNLTKVLLALDSSGNLWGEFTQGTLTQINTGNGSFITAGSRGKSATLFGREYLALSDGKFGLDIPRQYDGNFFDRVSQCGVGAGPFSVFDAAAESALTIAAAPNGAVRDGNGKVTITTTTAHGYTAGQFAAIAGVTDGSFNGTFQITSVPSITTFTYVQTGAASNSGAGTATMVPQISAGIHKVSVIFVTRQGYLTAPSPPVAWNSVGGRRVTLFGIPLALSDANVVACIVCFTVTGGASFYYTTGTNNTTNMVIPDNSTTNITLDFSDTMLLAGTLADPLFNLVELGECAGVIGYADRLFWWGERNKLNNWLNLSFDGGWGAGGGAWPQNVPLGWKADPTFGTGTLRDFSSIWGGSLDIIGDGVTATVGMITQSAVSDAFGVPRIAPNASYSVRARIKAYPQGIPTAGTVHVHLYSASGGINTTGIAVAWNDTHLSTTFYEYIAVLTSGLTSIPSDLVLRVYGDGTINNGAGFVIDSIEIYPTAQPYNASFVRASKDTDPESYDGVSGLIGVAVNDGTTVRAAFVLRNQLYFVKEHSIYSTQDDGVNEPADWTLSEISGAVGTLSADGVDIGEDWAAIADRSGLYIFDGGEPVKISQEIQPLWDQINWQYGHTLWVRVDTRNKRILVGVPIAPATQPNRILVLDYRGLSTAAEIASLGSVHASAYNGRLFAGGRARKWAPWNIGAKSAALVERADGTAQVFLGNGAGNGKIYQLSDAQLSDDGAAIPSYYTTYFFPSVDEEQSLQMRAHRKLFAYLTCYVEGAGNLSLSAFAANEAFATTLPSLALSSPASKDLELTINVLAERAAFQVGTNQAGSWFRLARLVPSLQPDPWAPVRGGN
jgi:hypothetical protein